MTASEREGAAHRRPRRKRRHPRRWLIALPVLAVGGWLWLQWQCWGLQTCRVLAQLPGLPQGFDGFTIVHLSDLHGHEYGAGSRELLERVRAERPDLIVVTGDLIDQKSQLEMVPALARGLAAIAPSYYVTGNHEWAAKVVRTLEPMLEDCGVTVLSNRYVMLERGGDRLALLGAEDPNGYADQKTIVQLANEVRAQEGAHTYQLLLSHRNNLYEKYATAGVDLTLSGHAHGGFIRLPGTDGLLGHSPEGLKIFPSYTAGLYPLKHGVLAVSRGLGNQPPTFRLFNRPDVPLVVLQP